jgi:hypothetical protein
MKIFRNMRQKLATQKKLGAYLRYAIGEILLVVIGILIALQVNNWNKYKSRKAEEYDALINLKQDFSYNKKQLDSLILKTNFFVEISLETLNHTGSKPKPKSQDDFNKLLGNLATTPHYYPQNGFLDDLINSGRLSIISNAQLRNKLSSWKPALDYIKYREELLTDYNVDIINYVIKRGSWLNADEVSNSFSGFKFPKSGFEMDNRKLLNDVQFENMTENHINFLLELKEKQQEAQKLTIEILELIEKEQKTNA